jgi:hypothetical protein
VTQPTPVKAERGALITIGLPEKNGPVHMKRAIELLKRHGYYAGPTSDEAILAIAHDINQKGAA